MSVNSINVANNPVLTNVVRGYTPGGFVLERILPVIPVSAYIGEIEVDGAEHFRVHDTNVTYDAQTPLLKFSMSKTNTWSIEEHAVKALITESDCAKANPMNPALGRTRLQNQFAIKVTNALKVSRENAVLTAITTTGNYTLSNTVTLSGTSQFNDYTNSDPLSRFQTAIQSVYDNSLMEANVAVMQWKTFNTLRFHPQLISRIATNVDRFGGLSVEQLAQALNVEEVVISTAKKNTAAEGQTAVMAPIMDKSIVFLAVDKQPVADMPSLSFGYSFRYQDLIADSWQTKEPKDGEFVRVTEKRDDVILGYQAAYLIKNAIA